MKGNIEYDVDILEKSVVLVQLIYLLKAMMTLLY